MLSSVSQVRAERFVGVKFDLWVKPPPIRTQLDPHKFASKYWLKISANDVMLWEVGGRYLIFILIFLPLRHHHGGGFAFLLESNNKITEIRFVCPGRRLRRPGGEGRIKIMRWQTKSTRQICLYVYGINSQQLLHLYSSEMWMSKLPNPR